MTSVITWVAVCSRAADIIACLASRNGRPRFATPLGACLPTIAAVTVLVALHVALLLDDHHNSYSPLVLLIFGFWIVPLNLAGDFTTTGLGARTR